MECVSFESLVQIIVRAINRMDSRLTGHGERIAYGMTVLLRDDPRFGDEEICKISLIALLHDIGAFERSKDIRDLLQLEKDHAFSHAEYGYLFHRFFSPYAEYAPVVLYHHSACGEVEQSPMPEKLKWVSKCLQVLDTMDLHRVAEPGTDESELLRYLKSLDNARYDPDAAAFIGEHSQELWRWGQGEQKKIHQAFLQQLRGFHPAPWEQEAILRTLVRSIDFRSHYTAIHCAVVVSTSDLLAQFCGLSEGERRAVHWGAMLHDLGKIAIPTRILESPGKLEGEDWQIMRSHVTATEEILSGCVSDEVLNIAVRHHETLDGKGYPRGLTGDYLTPAQRVVSVGDIVSALSEERSYKAALPLDQVVSILDGLCRNGKICSWVVQKFREHQQEIYDRTRQVRQEISAQYEKLYQEYARGGEF